MKLRNPFARRAKGRPKQEVWEASPQATAIHLVSCLVAAYEALVVEQGHILFPPGSTANERFRKCGELVRSLYREGTTELPAKTLKRYVSESDLQEMVWGLMCKEPAPSLTNKLTAKLYRHEVFQHGQDNDTELAPMSQMWETDGTPSTRTYARRATRRVGDGWSNNRFVR